MFWSLHQGRSGNTSTAESESDFDDPCSVSGQRSSAIPGLAPVHEEVSHWIC